MDFKQDKRLRQLAISNETKDMKREDDVSDLLEVNDLIYKLPRNLSVVAHRNMKKYTFQRSQYTDSSGSMIITLNTGAQWIHFKNSYLKFKVMVVTNAISQFSFGLGSACNLFSEIVISSRSGVELDRVSKLNLLRLHSDRLKMSEQDIYNNGSMMGYQPIAGAIVDPEGLTGDYKWDTAAAYDSTKSVTFCIPMDKLSGFFDSDKLCPAQLAGGMRIELTFENKSTAIIHGATAATTTSYTIDNPELWLDTFLLNDDSTRKLNQISAKNGLEYVYRSWHATTSSAISNQFNVDCSKAVSRALSAFAVSRDSDSLQKSQNIDSLASELVNNKYPVSQYQFRVGSTYFPQAYVTDSKSAYHNALYSAEKLNSYRPTGITHGDFNLNGLWQAHANLERSTVLNLTGIPLNNSRTLSLDMAFEGATGSGQAREVCIFLEYLCVARAYLNNVSISE